ncbi:MAG: hypothetical protein R3193_03375 [Marinobacter sp.]|nr:hypothetical protein [Marinobacter sp.]
MCGVRFNLTDLSKMSQGLPSKGFDVLKALHSVVQRVIKDPQVAFVGLNNEFVDSNTGPDCINWLNLVYPRPANWEDICASIGAPVQPISVRSIFLNQFLSRAWQDTLDYKSYHQALRASRSMRRHTRRQVALRIKQWLKPSGNQQTQSTDVSVFEGKDISRFCYEAWLGIYSGLAHKHFVPHWRYFSIPGFPDFPSASVLASRIQTSFCLNPKATYKSTRVDFRLAETDAKWLLRIQLWRGYLALAGHLQALSDVMRTKSTWARYYNLLTEDSASPWSGFAGFNFDPVTPHLMHIVVLRRHEEITRQSYLESLAHTHHTEEAERIADLFCDQARELDEPVVNSLNKYSVKGLD